MSARRRLNVSMYGRRDEGLRRPSVFAVGLTAAVAGCVLYSRSGMAAGAGGGASMPWTGPLQTLLDNLSGPTARIVAGLGFVIGGGSGPLAVRRKDQTIWTDRYWGCDRDRCSEHRDIVGVRWGGGLTCWSSMRSMHRCFGQCCSPELSRRWWWSRH